MDDERWRAGWEFSEINQRFNIAKIVATAWGDAFSAVLSLKLSHLEKTVADTLTKEAPGWEDFFTGLIIGMMGPAAGHLAEWGLKWGARRLAVSAKDTQIILAVGARKIEPVSMRELSLFAKNPGKDSLETLKDFTDSLANINKNSVSIENMRTNFQYFAETKPGKYSKILENASLFSGLINDELAVLLPGYVNWKLSVSNSLSARRADRSSVRDVHPLIQLVQIKDSAEQQAHSQQQILEGNETQLKTDLIGSNSDFARLCAEYFFSLNIVLSKGPMSQAGLADVRFAIKCLAFILVIGEPKKWVRVPQENSMELRSYHFGTRDRDIGVEFHIKEHVLEPVSHLFALNASKGFLEGSQDSTLVNVGDYFLYRSIRSTIRKHPESIYPTNMEGITRKKIEFVSYNKIKSVPMPKERLTREDSLHSTANKKAIYAFARWAQLNIYEKFRLEAANFLRH